MIKCDTAMRRSKMRARPWRELRVWRCGKNCDRCICGMKRQEDGTWEHIQVTKDGEAKQKTGRKKSK